MTGGESLAGMARCDNLRLPIRSHKRRIRCLAFKRPDPTLKEPLFAELASLNPSRRCSTYLWLFICTGCPQRRYHVPVNPCMCSTTHRVSACIPIPIPPEPRHSNARALLFTLQSMHAKAYAHLAAVMAWEKEWTTSHPHNRERRRHETCATKRRFQSLQERKYTWENEVPVFHDQGYTVMSSLRGISVWFEQPPVWFLKLPLLLSFLASTLPYLGNH